MQGYIYVILSTVRVTCSPTEWRRTSLRRPSRNVSCGGIPIVAGRHFPVSITSPVPVRVCDNLLLRSNECWDRTHSMGIVGASFNACEGSNSVVYYDANLFTLSRGTGKHCGTSSILSDVGNDDQTHVGTGHLWRMARVQTHEKSCASEYGR
jgi:hypothetical protein